MRDDKQRWPSIESMAKILEATGATLGELVSYVGDESDGEAYRNVVLISFAQAGASEYFDDAGYPVGGSWDEIRFPGLADSHAYALEITGDSMEPAYREGDTVIISPEANTRRGDRVVVKTTDGEIMAKQLLRSSAIKIDLTSFNPEHKDRSILVKDIDWIAHIIWASQ
jgi:phage repressor protein C with HTH and peptisase S24 domain